MYIYQYMKTINIDFMIKKTCFVIFKDKFVKVSYFCVLHSILAGNNSSQLPLAVIQYQQKDPQSFSMNLVVKRDTPNQKRENILYDL